MEEAHINLEKSVEHGMIVQVIGLIGVSKK